MPLLLIVFRFHNFGIEIPYELALDDDDSIFGAMPFNENTIHKLLKNELTLFHHLHVKLEDCALPLTWWKLHETRFLNVSFVARQILEVFGSHIEIEHIFNITRVLTSLRCCRLGIDNLDKFVMIMKKWLANAQAYWP
jgi:hypothetical protein